MKHFHYSLVLSLPVFTGLYFFITTTDFHTTPMKKVPNETITQMVLIQSSFDKLIDELKEVRTNIGQIKRQQAALDNSFRTIAEQQESFDKRQSQLEADFINMEVLGIEKSTQSSEGEEKSEHSYFDSLEKIQEQDSLMDLEPSNPLWELQTAAEIKTRIENLNIEKLVLDSTYCRGTTCRVEFSSSAVSAVDKLFEGDGLVSWEHSGKVHRITDSDGTQKIVFYIKGYL